VTARRKELHHHSAHSSSAWRDRRVCGEPSARASRRLPSRGAGKEETTRNGPTSGESPIERRHSAGGSVNRSQRHGGPSRYAAQSLAFIRRLFNPRLAGAAQAIRAARSRRGSIRWSVSGADDLQNLRTGWISPGGSFPARRAPSRIRANGIDGRGRGSSAARVPDVELSEPRRASRSSTRLRGLRRPVVAVFQTDPGPAAAGPQRCRVGGGAKPDRASDHPGHAALARSWLPTRVTGRGNRRLRAGLQTAAALPRIGDLERGIQVRVSPTKVRGLRVTASARGPGRPVGIIPRGHSGPVANRIGMQRSTRTGAREGAGHEARVKKPRLDWPAAPAKTLSGTASSIPGAGRPSTPNRESV